LTGKFVRWSMGIETALGAGASPQRTGGACGGQFHFGRARAFSPIQHSARAAAQLREPPSRLRPDLPSSRYGWEHAWSPPAAQAWLQKINRLRVEGGASG
jgi:hypothetical protein